MNNRSNKPFYKKWWFIIIIILFIIGSIGYDHDAENQKSDSENVDDAYQDVVDKDSGTEVSIISELVQATTEAIDPNIQNIIDYMELNRNEAELVFQDLRSVGLMSISEIVKDAGTGVDNFQAFYASCDGHKTSISIENRKTYYIGIGVAQLYDASKGGFIDNYQDYSLGDLGITYYMSLAEEYIKSILKTPSTAKFPSKIKDYKDWNISRYKDVLAISTYVDSQNSYGAMLRSYFTVQISISSDDLLYVLFNDKVVYGEFKPMNKN